MALTSLDELPSFNKLPQFENTRVGFTSGCFDLLHFHHLHYLERCKRDCDILIVGVDADDFVRRNKSKDPIIPEYHRAAMVAGLRCVDIVFIMSSLDDYREAAEHASVIYKNGLTIYGTETIGKEKLVIIPDIKDASSTTELIEKIKNAPRSAST